jgi:small subunit ribosomal protein S21
MNNRKPAWKRGSETCFKPLEVVVINNDIEGAIKVLKNKMIVEGVLAEVKSRKFAEKPSEKKRRRHREALRKLRKSRGRKARFSRDKREE